VTIGTGAKDLAGNPLGAAYSFGFTTGSAPTPGPLGPVVGFSAGARVDDGLGVQLSQGPSSIVGDSGGFLYVGFTDKRTGSYEAYVSRSIDVGLNWTSPIRINVTSSGSHPNPPMLGLHSVSGNVLAIYRIQNTQMYFSKTSNRGVSWTADQSLGQEQTIADITSL
jgi:hypothetical protein